MSAIARHCRGRRSIAKRRCQYRSIAADLAFLPLLSLIIFCVAAVMTTNQFVTIVAQTHTPTIVQGYFSFLFNFTCVCVWHKALHGSRVHAARCTGNS